MHVMHRFHGLRIRPAVDLVLRTVRVVTTRRRWARQTGKRLSRGIALAALLLAARAASAQPPAPPPPVQATPAAPAAPGAAAAQPPAARPRLIVSDLSIQGNRLVSTELIKNQLKTQVGKEFVAEVLQDDVRNLYATRQFGNVWADKQEDGPGKVRIIIHIRDYPNLVQKVTYQGNRTISKDDLETVTGIRTGVPLNPIANKVACQRIMARYQEDGRSFVHCDLLKGADPADTEVVFNITEGPITRVKDVGFTGNTFVSGAVLKNRVNTSSKVFGLFGGRYNPAMTDNDVHELIKYFRGFGFHDVKVNRELRYSGDGREVSVIFHIQEGVRYRVENQPRVVGVKSVAAEALEAHGKVQAGEFYDESKIKQDTAQYKNYIGATGREVRVTANQVFSAEKPGLMQVEYQVEERPVARVGQIFIVGNDRTRMNVILRQLPLYPGQILSYPELLQAERNLARLNIFETSPDGSVKPTVTVLDNPANPDSPYKDILINVQEASTGSLMFGVGVNSSSGLNGSIVLNERNFDILRPPTSFDDLISGSAFRGAGQEFRVELVPGTQMSRYMATFREPFLFDSPYSLTTSGYYYQRFFNEYTEEREGGRFTIGRKLDQNWSVALTTRLENVNVSNVSFFAPPVYQSAVGDNFLAGFRGSLVFDSRDSVLRPTQGALVDASFEQVTGDHNFSLANLDASTYYTVYQRADGSGKQVLVLRGQLGWATANTPVYERYFAGGFQSLRGFQFRGVGPDINGFKVGGDWLTLASAEYQVPIRANDQIYLVGFVDSGTVGPNISDWSTYRVSAGFGVRFVIPMLGPVPIALDFGFPIVRGKADREQVFNFFMGFTR
jgi:outer membrane protein assembly complex protein YaeT